MQDLEYNTGQSRDCLLICKLLVHSDCAITLQISLRLVQLLMPLLGFDSDSSLTGISAVFNRISSSHAL